MGVKRKSAGERDAFEGTPRTVYTPRVCEESGCETLLSRYNDFDFCSLHAPMFVPRMRGKVL